MELKICHLYPDILNLYGDRGNIICMRRRLEARGIGCSVTPLGIGDSADLACFDLVFIGGGQDFEQTILMDDLHRGKAADIRSAVADGLPFLLVCGGYQLLGRYYRTADGTECDYIGALDLYTEGSSQRMIGNTVCRSGEAGLLIGFENHGGKTYLGPGLEPLGQVLLGSGNNGADGGEGVRWNNVYGTYYHGPVLPKNPEFCDLLLKTALERKYGHAELGPLDDSAENSARAELFKRFNIEV